MERRANSSGAPPAGCYVTDSLPTEVVHSTHCTALGCGDCPGRASINIALRWSASTSRSPSLLRA